ncbi:MAG: hypothetical protein ACK50Q_14215 [Labrys sp. (in: a-proteobacteria)]|jgi:hypothetical protein
MSAVSTAAAIIGMQAADTSNAIAAKILKMNAKQGEQFASMLDQALSATKQMQAAKPPGTGTVVDVTA